MGVAEHGVEDCKPAGAGETVERPGRLNERILWPLWSNMSLTLMGVGSLFPKDVSSMYLLRGEEPLDRTDNGTAC